MLCQGVAVAFAQGQKARGSLDSLRARAPSVVWDTAAVRADVDGDGVVDDAYLGRARGRIFVGVVLGGARNVDVLEFAISARIQEAICSEPATLAAEPANYPGETVGTLKGFRPSAKASGLRLAGGDCDSIHLYWDHDQKRLGWWRL
jgi:hypothetical protein